MSEVPRFIVWYADKIARSIKASRLPESPIHNRRPRRGAVVAVATRISYRATACLVKVPKCNRVGIRLVLLRKSTLHAHHASSQHYEKMFSHVVQDTPHLNIYSSVNHGRDNARRCPHYIKKTFSDRHKALSLQYIFCFYHKRKFFDVGKTLSKSKDRRSLQRSESRMLRGTLKETIFVRSGQRFFAYLNKSSYENQVG